MLDWFHDGSGVLLMRITRSVAEMGGAVTVFGCIQNHRMSRWNGSHAGLLYRQPDKPVKLTATHSLRTHPHEGVELAAASPRRFRDCEYPWGPSASPGGFVGPPPPFLAIPPRRRDNERRGGWHLLSIPEARQ